jgi:DNA gyrase subunit B
MAESVQALSDDLLSIRKRPSMYIGGHDPLSLVWEVVSNSIDEFMAGRATRISVTVHTDGSVAIEDDGRGLPMEGGSGSIAVRAFTTVHLDGTLDGHGPHVHIEPLNVGLVVVNALSRWVTAESRAAGVVHALRCEDARVVEGPRVVETGVARGTIVAFLPDPQFFDAPVDFIQLRTKLSLLASLCPGLVIDLEDRRVQKARFHEPGGVAAWSRWDDRGSVGAGVRFDALHGELRVRGALRWTEHPEHVLEFANLVSTNPSSGKNHVGLMRGLGDALRGLAAKDGLPEDIATIGLDGIVQVMMENPQLGDPNKRRLDSPEAAEAVRAVVARAMGDALRDDDSLARMFKRRLGRR